MNENYSNKKHRISMGNRVQIPFGIMLTLLGLIGLLNRWLGAYVTYLVSYLFGILYFFVYLLLMLWGVNFIFETDQHQKVDGTKKPRISVTFIGLLIFNIALLMLASHFYVTGLETETLLTINQITAQRDLVMGTLADALTSPVKLFGDQTTFLGGGVIGDFAYLSVRSLIGAIGTYIVIGLLFLLGTLFTFWRLFVSLFKNVKTKHFDAKTRKKFFMNAASLEAENDKFETPKPINRPITPVGDTYENQQVSSQPLRSMGLKKAIFYQEESVIPQQVQPAIVEEPVTTPKPIATTPSVNPYIPQTAMESAPLEIDDLLDHINNDETNVTLEVPSSEEAVEVQPRSAYQSSTAKIDIAVKPIITTPKAKERQDEPKIDKQAAKPKYVYPDISLLEEYETEVTDAKNEQIAQERVELINEVLDDFGVGAKVISYTIGPAVTQYDIQTNRDVSVSTVSRTIDDIMVRLGGIQSRFSALVEGKVTSGLEIPNYKTSTVGFKDCIKEMPAPDKYKNKMLIPFGKNISGKVVFAPLHEFPHLLVAGSTGSGKSIFMHSLLMTLIMRNNVDELKLVIIDPKRVEMMRYRELPHLLCPIITGNEEAKVALNRLADEMEHRYDLFEQTGASNISQYNEIMIEEGKPILPTIIVIIDEYADLVEGAKDIATPVVRIAQKSRAAGIHLIISTQRPSVNVITGTIKANLPTRVALMVASAVDSGTIIGMGGAEKLLGNGDMLVNCVHVSRQGVARVQGAYVDNKEIRRVVNFLAQNYQSNYDPNFLDLEEKPTAGASGTNEVLYDEKYPEVKDWVMSQDYTSINKIMQAFGFGFTRASRMFTMLQNEEVVESSGDYNTSSRGCRVLQQHQLSPEEYAIKNNDY